MPTIGHGFYESIKIEQADRLARLELRHRAPGYRATGSRPLQDAAQAPISRLFPGWVSVGIATAAGVILIMLLAFAVLAA